MSCERCAARPAKLKYTELREGKSRVLWICEECARELGFGSPEGEEEPGPEEPRPLGEAGSDPPGEPADPSGEKEDPPAGPPPSLQKIVLGVVGVSAGLTGGGEEAIPGEEYAAVRCEDCGITGAELRDRTLLGCPRCYETFGKPLNDLLLRLHGALEHEGRLPGGARAVPPDAAELHRELREAIEGQDFETAARLRDRLRRLRGRPE
ncbi:MAG TPA: UvrB/UvrC motif-containing protein [bacterium]|nr:UvrB/UvrC motif-containing protein [bacterium]